MTGEPEIAGTLLRALQENGETLSEIARVAAASDPGFAAALGDRDIEQLTHAFKAILVEALEGRPPTTRRLLLETAIPALVESGQSVETIAQVVTCFAVLLTELIVQLPDDAKRSARLWLAAFMGDYARDIVGQGRHHERRP